MACSTCIVHLARRYGLGYKFIGKSPQTWTVHQDFLPNKEQLKHICDISTPRIKALILVGKDLGCAPEDLINLSLEVECSCHGTIKKQLDEGRHGFISQASERRRRRSLTAS
jgi:hypothetical protein